MKARASCCTWQGFTLKIDSEILGRASRLDPPALRSLDAIHLASALSLGDDLGAIAVYDTGLATAAATIGFQILAPGATGPI